MNENKMNNTWHVCIKSILHISLKSRTQNYHPTSLRWRIGDWDVCSITLLKLPQNWVICIEKDGPNNFAQVTTTLGNPYWKHCLLIKNVNKIHETEVFLGSNLNFTIKVFTWGLANDDNICKKIFNPIWSIIQ